MHAAPSVTYPVGRSAFALVLALVLAAAGLAVALLWTVQSDNPGWRQALALAAAAAGGTAACAAWRRSPTGVLRWDGSGWSWQEGGAGGATGRGRPEIALDLQNRMLLRWQPETGRARWLWPERATDPAHWAALRRAVYSRASAPVPAAGEPPTAEQ